VQQRINNVQRWHFSALKFFNIRIFGLDREEPDVRKKFDSAKQIEEFYAISSQEVSSAYSSFNRK